MFPGVPQNRAVAQRQTLWVNPDGSAEQDVLVIDSNAPAPIVRVAVWDLDGRLRYKNETNKHVFSRPNPYGDGKTIYSVQFPAKTFLRNTCKVNVEIDGKTQVFYSQLRMEGFIGLGCGSCECNIVVEPPCAEDQTCPPTPSAPTSSSNVAATLGITHREADTFTRSFNFTQNNAPLDITTWDFEFIISQNDVAVLTFTLSSGLVIQDTNKLIVSDTMLPLAVGTYDFEIRATLPTAQVRTMIAGPFTIVNSNG